MIVTLSEDIVRRISHLEVVSALCQKTYHLLIKHSFNILSYYIITKPRSSFNSEYVKGHTKILSN